MFDATVLKKLTEGDRNAFNDVFRYFYPRLMAYALSMVDEAIAEDIVQDVFLNLWKNHKKIYVSMGFHSYLFQSVYTHCLDYFKKECSCEKYAQYVESNHIREHEELIYKDSSIIEDLYTKDFYAELYKLLNQIPDQRREVFILAYIKGIKTKEVAEITQLPQRTVESHIYLTLKFLKTHMSKKDFLLFSLLYFILKKVIFFQ